MENYSVSCFLNNDCYFKLPSSDISVDYFKMFGINIQIATSVQYG